MEIHHVELCLIDRHFLRVGRLQSPEPVVVEETRQMHDAVAVVALSLLLGPSSLPKMLGRTVHCEGRKGQEASMRQATMDLLFAFIRAGARSPGDRGA